MDSGDEPLFSFQQFFRPGHFLASADIGTLFFDEIAEIISLQQYSASIIDIV
jgi:hypothetical protein